MAGKRANVDWDALEPHYRAGIRALKDIGAEFDVSDAAIIKHARKNGWDRNLKAKIQAKADAKVSAAMVSVEVSAGQKLTETVRVDIESEIQSRIRLAHRSDIGRGRSLAMALFAELEGVTADPEAFAKLREMMIDPGADGSACAAWPRKDAEGLGRQSANPDRQGARGLRH
jgi:hypothetical protein